MKLRKQFQLLRASKRILYLGINWTKQVQDFSIENYKTSLKEIKEDLHSTIRDWKTNIFKMAILPTLIYRFNIIPSKILAGFLHKLMSWLQNSYGNAKNTEEPKQTWKEQTWWTPTSWFQNKCTIIKTVGYWHKAIYTYQWNRIESPEANPNVYNQLIFDKGAKKFNGGKIFFSLAMLVQLIIPCERMKLNPYFMLYIKINSKWIEDLNRRAKTIKLLRKNTGENLHDFE